VKAARPSRWTVSRVLPIAASLALASITGYQSLVIIPGLRSGGAMAPIVLRPAERGEDQVIQPDARRPYSAILLDVNEAEPGAALVYEASPAGGPVRAKGSAEAPAPGLALLVMLPNSKLDQPGPWALVLRTPKGEPIARYPFTLKLK
jgi:hypothetical protein